MALYRDYSARESLREAHIIDAKFTAQLDISAVLIYKAIIYIFFFFFKFFN